MNNVIIQTMELLLISIHYDNYDKNIITVIRKLFSFDNNNYQSNKIPINNTRWIFRILLSYYEQLDIFWFDKYLISVIVTRLLSN